MLCFLINAKVKLVNYFHYPKQVPASLCRKSCDACKHPNLVSKYLEELTTTCQQKSFSRIFMSRCVNFSLLFSFLWCFNFILLFLFCFFQLVLTQMSLTLLTKMGGGCGCEFKNQNLLGACVTYQSWRILITVFEIYVCLETWPQIRDRWSMLDIIVLGSYLNWHMILIRNYTHKWWFELNIGTNKRRSTKKLWFEVVRKDVKAWDWLKHRSGWYRGFLNQIIDKNGSFKKGKVKDPKREREIENATPALRISPLSFHLLKYTGKKK